MADEEGRKHTEPCKACPSNMDGLSKLIQNNYVGDEIN